MRWIVGLTRLMTALETSKIEIEAGSEIEAWGRARQMIDQDEEKANTELEWTFMEVHDFDQIHVGYIGPDPLQENRNGDVLDQPGLHSRTHGHARGHSHG
jgi:hypothetical protein